MEEYVTQKMHDLRELADKKAEGDRHKAEWAEAAKEACKAKKHPASVAVDERLLKMQQGQFDDTSEKIAQPHRPTTFKQRAERKLS